MVGRAPREPRGELDPARADRHQHQPALQGRPRPGHAPNRERAGAARQRRSAMSAPSSRRKRPTMPARSAPRCSAIRYPRTRRSCSWRAPTSVPPPTSTGSPGPCALRAGPARGLASFDNDWVPRQYLADYYQAVEPDERATIAFFVDAAREWEPDEPILFFGVGPTLHHVFWPPPRRPRFTWATICRRTCARSSGGSSATPGPTIGAHSSATRWSARACRAHRSAGHRARGDYARQDHPPDAGRPSTRNPLGESAGRYSTVISAYCADSATDDRATWQTYMQRIAGMVRPDGTLLIAALRSSRGYRVGGRRSRARTSTRTISRRSCRPSSRGDFRSRLASWPRSAPRAIRASFWQARQRPGSGRGP